MKKKFLRQVAFFMALNILFEVASPTVAMALTNGSTQPDFIGFEPANSSEMIDLFTGDFKYNIPIMDVDGYPLNISYHAGQNMESEASWVGLGWSLNPGALNRNVRGLPDDFNGELLSSYTSIKPHAAMGAGFQKSAFLGPNVEFQNFGVANKIGGSGAIVLTYNNYKGYGLEVELDGQNTMTTKAGLYSSSHTNGVGMKISSQDGGTLSHNYANGVGVNFGQAGINSVNVSASMGEGTSTNTRTGAVFKSASQGLGVSVSVNGSTFGVGGSISHTIPTGNVSYAPSINNNYTGHGFSLSAKAGLWGACKLFVAFVAMQQGPISGGLQKGFKGYYNLNKLEEKSRTTPSYGYLYSENAPEDALMDFNRFRDGSIMDETPNLNLTVGDYDVFSANAQGLGLAFRPFRSDIGVYHDNVGQTKSKNFPIEGELGVGLLVHFLMNISKTTNNGKSGVWNTLINSSLAFNNKDIRLTANQFYEKYYFKQLGEIAGRDANFDAARGGEGLTSPFLQKIGNDYHALSMISGANKTKRETRNNYIQSLTASEATKYGNEPSITLYPKTTASVDPSTRLVVADPTYSLMSRTTKTLSVLSGTAMVTSTATIGHHLSEVSVTNPEGTRYIYGIPSYNLVKNKVIFNASNRTEGAYQGNGFPGATYCTTCHVLPHSDNYQTVQYDPTGSGKEMVNNNVRGADNFYRQEITQPYATTYLLTSILSTDYVDITGDGQTYDDLGNFTKLNYYKNNNFGWREPYCFPGAASTGTPGHWATTKGTLSLSANQANFEPGLIADELDDRGFYEYGVRENYYVHSIETKNYVAFFETSDRYDGMGVSDPNGTPQTNQNLKLDVIKLYSKSEIIAKGGVANSVPIKTVRFEYDYSLCPGTFNSDYESTYNSDRGKLTLKRIYFSYGNSDKSALSPYQFTYGGNFNYGPRDIDRWGSYKINGGTPTGSLGVLNNQEFPYADQDKTNADAAAEAWNLTQIKTPTGANINVTYESDDYGYVQNEQAGQMLQLKNILASPNPTDDATTYSPNSNIKDADYFLIDMSKLHRGVSATSTYSNIAAANNFVRKNIIKPGKKLYFKSFLKLAGPGNSFVLKKPYYEFVSGYATVLNVGVFTSTHVANTYLDGLNNTCYKYAYVQVQKEIAYDSKDVNPITIAGWDYMRNFLPRIAYPGSEPANMGNTSHKPLKQFQNMVVGLGVAMADFVNGISGKPNKRFYNKNFCNEMDFSKSFVRAYVPYKTKLGGGYRVKRIITEDNWDTMTSSQEVKNTYGQDYTYTTKEGTTTISSGVALYEPLFGGDEISLRQPIEFDIIKSMAPNDHFYQEKPFAETLYPAPIVGYSKVTVTSIADPVTSPTVTGIGKTEFEFYTAKDFPIIYQTTGITKKPIDSDIIEDFIISPSITKIFHASQGHLVKLNDMHGKLKSVLSYGEDNPTAPISGTRYFYKQVGPTNGSKQLITSVQTINEKNQIATAAMSRDIDLSTDTRENISESVTLGNSFLLEIGLGINLVVIPPLPYPVPTPLPFLNEMHDEVIYGEQRIGVRTASMTKVIQQYGILDKVQNFNEKASVTTQNLLWDKNTGAVVLTSTTNNLDQPVYNFNYPAYWMYPQMGHEFNRDNIEIACPVSSSLTLWNATTGTLAVSGFNNPRLLSLGDEVTVMTATTNIFVPSLTNSLVPARFWVTSDPINPSTNYFLCDETGKILNGSAPYSLSSATDYVIKVTRPINRNNLNSSAGYVTSLTTPVISGIIDYTNGVTPPKIIDVSVQEFCTGSSFYLNPAMAQQSLTNVSPSYSDTPFNPITSGLYGNFRPSKTYNYSVARTYTTQPNVKTDGVYSGTFSPYWMCTPGAVWFKNVTADWVVMNNNKYYSPYGQLLEIEDGISIPHAQRFGFNHTLPTLSATSAKADEVAFDSFEDYSVYSSFTNTTQVYNNDYLGFYKQVTQGSNVPSFNNSTAHTGKSSLYFATSKAAVLTHNMYFNLPIPLLNTDEFTGCNPYILDCSKLNLRDLNGFAAKKYIISFWIKGTTQALDYSNQPTIALKTVNTLTVGSPLINTTTLTPTNKTGIINSWQKLDYQFSVPVANAATHPAIPSTVQFTISSSGATSFYLDDFRIQPFNSTMVCNVYDQNHLRLWAQFDDQNFATIMEYNNEGMLVSKKKETLKGLYTLQESNKGLIKN
ncbi:MAG: hypothetical protein Q8L81_10350 [Bacteroidota bacterium]|nr:hypothetical protein [Bacteroidota bacterium]